MTTLTTPVYGEILDPAWAEAVVDQIDTLSAFASASYSVFAYKTGDTTRTSTATFADDPHLTVTVAANTIYVVDASLIYLTAATPDIKFSWTLPSGGTMTNWGFRYRTHDGTETSGSTAAGTDTVSITAAATPGPNQTIVVRGLLVTSSAGTFAVRWAQNTSDSGSTSFKQNSWLRLTPVQVPTPDSPDVADLVALSYPLNLLTSGEEVIPRDAVGGEVQMVAGTMHLSYFTARTTGSITGIKTTSGAASTGATLARVGIYSIDASTGAGTLVASIASDLTLWASSYTTYTRSLTVALSKVKGTRYAIGVLFTGTTPPEAECNSIRFGSAAQAPRISGDLSGQTNLPASFADASLSVSHRRYQMILT